MTKKHKFHFKKFLPLFFLVIFAAQLIFTNVLGTPSAQAASTPVNDTLQQEYKTWAGFNFVSFCMDNARDTLNKGSTDYTTAAWVKDLPIFSSISSTTVNVGSLIDSDDGQLDCGNGGDLLTGLKLIGYSTIEDFMSEFYPKSGNCSGDECPHRGLNPMRDRILNRITSKGWRGPDNSVNDLSPAAQYWFMRYQFETTCGATPYKSNNDQGFKDASVNNKNEASNEKMSYFIITDGPKVEERNYATFKLQDDDGLEGLGFKFNTNPYHPDTGSDQDAWNCIEIGNKGLTQTRANAYNDMLIKDVASCIAAGGKPEDCAKNVSSALSPIAPTGSTIANTSDDSCEAAGGVLSWIACPVIDMIASGLNWMDTQVALLMTIDRDKYTGPDLYSAWSKFRNIGLTLLVIMMLVMVIATAIGSSLLEAYTVKKAIPRMIMSIFFIMLSWYVCIFLIDFFNVLGQGILGLMTSPFGTKAQSLSGLFTPSVGGAGLQIGGIVIFGAAIAKIGPLLGILGSFLGAGLLIMLISFLVLVARQMFIIVLILFSPIAILSWVFPNNNKIWKFWWESFTKLLIMFPMVMALIGSGRIFAAVISNLHSGGAEGGLLNPILKLIAYIIPYAFIPLTFKAAGGLFSNLVGMANDRSKGVFDRLRKGRQAGWKQIGHDAQSGRLLRGSEIERSRAGRISRGVAIATKIPKSRPGSAFIGGAEGRAAFRSRLLNSYAADEAREQEENIKKSGMDLWAQDDEMIWGAHGRSISEIKSRLAERDPGRFAGPGNAETLDRAAQRIWETKRMFGSESSFRQALADFQSKTGTGYQFTNADGTKYFDAGSVLDDLVTAYEDDSTGMGSALARIRSNLAQSGQVAGLAGYGVWAANMTKVREAHKQLIPGDAASEKHYQDVLKEAHEAIMEDTIVSVAPGQAVYGKPTSAAAIGEAHLRRIDAIVDSINGKGQIEVRDTASNAPLYQTTTDAAGNTVRVIDPVTGEPIKLTRQATQEDLDVAMANAAGIYDAMAQASPNNANAFAEKLMSAELPDAPELEVTVTREKWADGKRAQNPDGSPAFEIVTERRKPKTVREYIQSQMNGSTKFADRRKEYSAATYAQAQQAAAANAALQGQNPVQPGVGGMPTGPIGG